MNGAMDRHHRWRTWLERRELIEAKPLSKRRCGQMRSQLYGTAWRVHHHVLRPTPSFRGHAKGALRLDLTELILWFADLPAAFDGYRILHLPGLHLDNIDDTAAEAAARFAGIESDLCVITGDIRDNNHAPLQSLMERLEHVLSLVSALDGVVSALGNRDGAAMVTPMERIGIRVRLNEMLTLSRDTDGLHITGLHDVHRFPTEEAYAALDAAPVGFCIALVRSPGVAGRAAERHRLYLTGHTHGGRICLPGQRAFTSGLKRHRDLGKRLWRHGRMVGYASRSIGACIVPFRSHCPGRSPL